MVAVTVTDRAGAAHRIDATQGETLMQAIADANLEVAFGICGGACACASCHVILDEATFASLGPAGADEDALLDSSEFRGATSRLSCQMTVTDTLAVTIAQEG